MVHNIELLSPAVAGSVGTGTAGASRAVVEQGKAIWALISCHRAKVRKFPD